MDKVIFESHAHYDDTSFDNDRDELLLQIQKQGIRTIVNVAASLESVKSTIKLAEKYPFVYAAIGVHPSETEELDDENFLWLRKQIQTKKIVAIGEIGLDYHWPEPEREIQKKWFIRQLQMAREENLPVIIHSREAAKDTLDIMKEVQEDRRTNKGVMHCFSYSKEVAQDILRMGYYVGIGGVVTFKNAKKMQEVVERLPLDRILLETDSPYLAPEPHRGTRNNSSYLSLVAKKIAEIKKITIEEVLQATTDNAEELFQIKENII